MSSSLGNTQLLVGRAGGYSSNYTADISGSLYCANGCVLAASGGYVGIGTTNPTQLLDITNTVGSANIRLCSLASAGYITSSYNLGVNSYVGIQSSVNTTSALGTPQFVVSNNGYVGIGTTNPTQLLDISASGTNPVLLMIRSNGTDSQIGLFNGASGARNWYVGSGSSASGAGPNFYIYDAAASTTRFAINSSGNVGIGVVNPGCALSFPNNETNKVISLYDLGPTDAAATASNFYGFGVNSAVLRYQVPAGNTHRFYNGTTNSVTINSSGYVGIGTTNPAYTLDVNGFMRVGSSGTPFKLVQFGQNVTSASGTFTINLNGPASTASIFTTVISGGPSSTILGLGPSGSANSIIVYSNPAAAVYFNWLAIWWA